MTDELAQRSSESTGQAVEGGAAIRARGGGQKRLRPDLTDPSLYFNRELSWLDFNDRVLQLAEDPRVPLLERVNFSAIYEDNLDEFFMVRVAEPPRPGRVEDRRAGCRRDVGRPTSSS